MFPDHSLGKVRSYTLSLFKFCMMEPYLLAVLTFVIVAFGFV